MNKNTVIGEGMILIMERSNLTISKENNNNNIKGTQKTKRIIYYILGTLEVLFAFRLSFKILGANPESIFVAILYSITDLFLAPFAGIFRTAVTKGIETQSVLEPALVIAMVVYVLLAWGITKLIYIINNRKDNKTL